ncbi:hypothetical protein DES40_0401 [Litorimonas taeanensis]|uniref:Uncharacterized protein n=1 Tax=Litorimonas taeanensis TaxID=568099 RepID=A0A420WJA4_9PROT|nr:hypothetical protein [Litorimonas taeanensis]RKQ71093.1 hypothetical protein DES40_0401 [Litorimonas taeanensis]
MLNLLLDWLPLVIGLLLALLRINRLWLAIPLFILGYFLTLILSATRPALIDMTASGAADPEQIAGAMSEYLVTGIMRAIIDIPIIIAFWFYRKKRRLGP